MQLSRERKNAADYRETQSSPRFRDFNKSVQKEKDRTRRIVSISFEVVRAESESLKVKAVLRIELVFVWLPAKDCRILADVLQRPGGRYHFVGKDRSTLPAPSVAPGPLDHNIRLPISQAWVPPSVLPCNQYRESCWRSATTY